MNKPTMKRTVGFISSYEGDWSITFDASLDVAKEFEEFGGLWEDKVRENRYTLTVDRRYDFQEVVTYVKCYEPPRVSPEIMEVIEAMPE